MAQGPDSQEFGKLQTYYPWLGTAELALLQGVFQTWRQLADASTGSLCTMLAGLPRPTDAPGITMEQVAVIQSFAGVMATLADKALDDLQEPETT